MIAYMFTPVQRKTKVTEYFATLTTGGHNKVKTATACRYLTVCTEHLTTLTDFSTAPDAYGIFKHVTNLANHLLTAFSQSGLLLKAAPTKHFFAEWIIT